MWKYPGPVGVFTYRCTHPLNNPLNQMFICLFVYLLLCFSFHLSGFHLSLERDKESFSVSLFNPFLGVSIHRRFLVIVARMHHKVVGNFGSEADV